MQLKIAEAFAARKADMREKVEAVREQIQFVRESAPTLTTALLLIVFAIGGAVGWFASQPFTRSAVNKEWRSEIAAKSANVRSIVAAGNEEADATDNAIIKALGDTDARLSSAENALRSIKPNAIAGECRVPASRLRQ